MNDKPVPSRFSLFVESTGENEASATRLAFYLTVFACFFKHTKQHTRHLPMSDAVGRSKCVTIMREWKTTAVRHILSIVNGDGGTMDGVANEYQRTFIDHSRELFANLINHEVEADRTHVFSRALRSFSSTEVAQLLGVNDGYLRRLSLCQRGPLPITGARGRRLYTDRDVQALRRYLHLNGKGNREYLPSRREGERAQIISVVSPKTGTGNTTIVAHLCQYLALHGYRTLAVDLDPFAALSGLCGVQVPLQQDDRSSSVDMIKWRFEPDRAQRQIVPTIFSNLDLLPGGLELLGLHRRASQVFTKSHESFVVETACALHAVAQPYDVVVVDCASGLNDFCVGAVAESTSVLFSVHPTPQDVGALAKALQVIATNLSDYKQRSNREGFAWVRYLISRFDGADTAHLKTASLLRLILGDHAIRFPWYESGLISEARRLEKTAFEIERSTVHRGKYDKTTEAICSVTQEIEGLIRASWGRTQPR
jgi:chromosome partitioning protein